MLLILIESVKWAKEYVAIFGITGDNRKEGSNVTN